LDSTHRGSGDGGVKGRAPVGGLGMKSPEAGGIKIAFVGKMHI